MLRAVGLTRNLLSGNCRSMRPLAATSQSQSLFKNFKEALKQESQKEGLDDEIRKLRKEVDADVKKVVESEKFKKIKKETATGFEDLKYKSDNLGKTIEEKLEDSKYGEKIKKTAESFGSVSEKVADIFESVKNMDITDKQSPEERMAVFTDDYVSPNYNPAKILRKRKQIDKEFRQIHYDADLESQGVAVHRDSIIYEKFKNSAMGQRMDDMSDRISASENTVVRGFVMLNSRVAAWGRRMSTNQYNEAITAIRKIDGNFDMENFVTFLEKEMIPILLEAKAINDTEILEDWCHDSAAQKFSIRHRERAKDQIKYFEKTINLEKLSIMDAKIHDDHPAIQIEFQTNLLMAYTDKNGNLIEQTGYPSPDEVYKCYHVWTLFRDPMEPEPAAAWRVFECEEYATKMAF